MVMFGHCYRVTIGNAPISDSDFGQAIQAVTNGIFNPQPAVLLFFVLSGFVLHRQISGIGITNSQQYLVYLLRRAFRLLPLMWVSLVFAYILLLFAPLEQIDGAYVLRITGDLVSAAAFQSTSINPVIWTLSVELIGSAILPLMYLVSSRAGWAANALLLLFLILLSQTVDQPVFVQFMVFFFIGVLVAHTPKWPEGKAWAMLASATTTASVAVYIWAPDIAGGPDRPWEYYLLSGWTWLEIPACFLIVYFAVQFAGTPYLALLRSRPLRFLGRISFSLYLLHWPIGLFFWPVLASAQPAVTSADKIISFVALASIVSILSVAISTVTYVFVERPFTEVGRQLGKSMASRKPQPGSV